jgi:hypothetical protein
MPTMTDIYMNASTLVESTMIYQDADMTYPALNGFYSDGIYSREMSGGVLFPAKICEECSPAPSSSQYRVVNNGDSVSVDYTNDLGAQQDIVPADTTVFVCSLTVPTEVPGTTNLTITLENQVCS